MGRWETDREKETGMRQRELSREERPRIKKKATASIKRPKMKKKNSEGCQELDDKKDFGTKKKQQELVKNVSARSLTSITEPS